MTKEEMTMAFLDQQRMNGGCGQTMAYGFIIATCVLCLLCGCKAVESTEQTIDYRHMARLTERMDSMMHATHTWQQSIYEKQTALVDSIRLSEVRDTSRTIFLGQSGDTIRERIIIRERVERDHTSQESTQEQYTEILRQTDSLIAVNRSLSEKVDSLLHLREETAVVTQQAPWYERLLDGIGRWVPCVVAGVLIGLVVRRRIFR